MTNEKFTQGEWGIFGSGDHGFVYITDNPQKEIQDQHIICQVQTNSKHSTIANAALIAAAPDMYHELSRECTICRLKDHEIECDFCRIGKVLKKARGEE